MSDFEDVHPLIVVGYEGLWGSMIMAVILIVFQFTPCNSNLMCSNGFVDNSYYAVIELFSSWEQILYTIALLPLVCFFNTSGTSVTAYGSAAARCTIEQVRNLLVWIYFLIVKVNGIKLETFSVIQLFGFIILLFGIMIFNEIL